jgi:hypothetical protein
MECCCLGKLQELHAACGGTVVSARPWCRIVGGKFFT